MEGFLEELITELSFVIGVEISVKQFHSNEEAR